APPIPTIFSTFSSENLGFSLVKLGFAVGDAKHHPIVGPRPIDGDIPLSHVVEDFIHRAAQWIAETAATGALDAHKIVGAQAIIAEARWQALVIICPGI